MHAQKYLYLYCSLLGLGLYLPLSKTLRGKMHLEVLYGYETRMSD